MFWRSATLVAALVVGLSGAQAANADGDRERGNGQGHGGGPGHGNDGPGQGHGGGPGNGGGHGGGNGPGNGGGHSGGPGSGGGQGGGHGNGPGNGGGHGGPGNGGGPGHGGGGPGHVPKPIETDPCIEYPEGTGNTEFDDYWQPHEIDRAISKLGRDFKTRVIGLSNRGRPIHSVRIGHGRKVVFVQAGIHANELTGTTAVMNLLKDLDDNSKRSREIRDRITLVTIPMLNPDGAVHYQRENDQTWAETQQRFPQLSQSPSAFYYDTPGPRFWGDPRVEGFDLNRDFNPNFNYVPEAAHLPGNGGVRGLNLTRESKASQGLYASLEREFRTVDVFVDLHNQAPCNNFDHDGDANTPTRYTPMSISAQFLQDPAAHGAGTTYPKFNYDASRRANVAAWLGTQKAGRPASDVTRYPQNLDLAGSANGSYQLHGSASVLMEAGRQRHANPEWNLSFIAKVHELAVRGVIDSVVDGWIDRIDPNRYEQIPIRN